MEWRLLSEDGVRAARGLATDEVLARGAGRGVGSARETLRLYTYRAHCALVGRFQNVAHEVHLPYCTVNDIEVNRRPTGGGAILMGEDQLGVALALHGRRSDLHGRPRELMRRFSHGLIRGLDRLGIPAAFRGKNDLEVGGRKIAGLGIYRDPSGGLLFHASLLVDLDVTLMTQVLTTPFARITERELAVVGRRTTTVRSLLGESVAMADVRAHVGSGFAESFDVELVPSESSDTEQAAIDELSREKYDTDDWVLKTTGVTDATGSATRKTPDGLLEARVAVAGRMLKAVYIGGDFFADAGALSALEGRLRWHSADAAAIAATVHDWASDRDTPDPAALAEVLVAATQNPRPGETNSAPYGCFVTPQQEPAR